MAKAIRNCCRGVTIKTVYLDRSVPENTPVEAGYRPFSKTEPVLFLLVTRPTGYISSAPSQLPLAFATYTILIPLWAASGHAPRPRNDSNVPPLPKKSISGLPPLVVPHERTPHDPRVAPSAPASSHKVPGSTTYSRLQEELMWAWSGYITLRAVSSS